MFLRGCGGRLGRRVDRWDEGLPRAAECGCRWGGTQHKVVSTVKLIEKVIEVNLDSNSCRRSQGTHSTGKTGKVAENVRAVQAFTEFTFSEDCENINCTKKNCIIALPLR